MFYGNITDIMIFEQAVYISAKYIQHTHQHFLHFQKSQENYF